MKATVREYTVRKKVVVVEMDLEEAERLMDGPAALNGSGQLDMARSIEAALLNELQSDAKEDEDVPF